MSGSNTESKLIKKKKQLRNTSQPLPPKTEDVTAGPWNQSPISGLMVSIFINCLCKGNAGIKSGDDPTSEHQMTRKN